MMKAARAELADARMKRDIAKLDYDAEVKLYDQCQQNLHDAFRNSVPMDRFLEFREMKRLQARIVRDAHARFVAAITRVDIAENDYDIAFNVAAGAGGGARGGAEPARC